MSLGQKQNEGKSLLERATQPERVDTPPLLVTEAVAPLGDLRLPQLRDYITLEPDAPALFNSLGKSLPEPSEQLRAKEWWTESGSPLGRLASKSAVSLTTGCWSVLKGRDAKGYVRIYGKEFVEASGFTKSRYGILTHRLAYLLFQRELGLSEQIEDGLQIDHRCRNPYCCNPRHLEKVDNAQNDRRKIRAHVIENRLALGQIATGPTHVRWIDQLVARATQGHTGVTISTRFGPHEVIKLNDEPSQFTLQKASDDLYDNLLPRAKAATRKSRARRPVILEGQLNLAV